MLCFSFVAERFPERNKKNSDQISTLRNQTKPNQTRNHTRDITLKTTASDVSASAWLQQVLALLFPSNLVAKAALFALVVAMLPLGQAEAPRIGELPHGE